MNTRIGQIVLSIGIIMAGCIGSPVDNNPESPVNSTSIQNTSTVESSFSLQSARKSVIEKERVRVESILRDSPNLSGETVGIYGETRTNIKNTSGSNYYIVVQMSYSYEYDCQDRSGSVDGLMTKSLYKASNISVRHMSIIDGVNILC